MLIEDYALVGDLQSAALIGSDGAVDWLCVPRFDSPSCFSALVGDASHGRWRLAPAGGGADAATLGFPGTATKNTTRVETSDPTQAAAAIARAVYPGKRPSAVVLADALADLIVQSLDNLSSQAEAAE